MAQQRRGGRKRRKVDYLAANHISPMLLSTVKNNLSYSLNYIVFLYF